MKIIKPKIKTCRYCGGEYFNEDIKRIYGKTSAVYILGYCSAEHYTKHILVKNSTE